MSEISEKQIRDGKFKPEVSERSILLCLTYGSITNTLSYFIYNREMTYQIYLYGEIIPSFLLSTSTSLIVLRFQRSPEVIALPGDTEEETVSLMIASLFKKEK
ncbi:hypothetical protein RUM44_003521 [Polyplax serrata]|uniref:Uncharacterized protein n=1 Tax=Polyplax serrata TaxID=468196 RepID=A0ABR1AGP8_POLSC